MSLSRLVNPLWALLLVSVAHAQAELPLVERYAKIEYKIPMRDGTKLYTICYVPKNKPGKHPILLERTPYGIGPYGPKGYAYFGGSHKFQDLGYIFAYQDVRGAFMSEGQYVNIRPLLKPGQKGVDESTDTYDTVDFLVKHVPDNNKAVGLWGISYPGFYAAAGAVNTHPCLKAVSPQAPVSDWWKGDDIHHNGVFFLQDNFDFSAWFDFPRKGLETEHQGLPVDRGDTPAYKFFLDAGGTADGVDRKYLGGKVPYWQEIAQHPDYDAYWQERSLPTHFKNVKCAVLTVGGWFDAEDMWGALNLFRSGEKNVRGGANFLVMGPWFHGMWAGGRGNSFGDLRFNNDTASSFRENVEFPFFEKYLRGQGDKPLAKAVVFETGANVWHSLTEWPPKNAAPYTLYLGSKSLSEAKPTEGEESFVNDPANPTPYIERYTSSRHRPAEYMIDDQRFAEKRADVLTYRGPALDQDLVVAGPIDVDCWIKTTGTDADLVVKVIDVWPSDSKETSPRYGTTMADYEQLLRGDIMRCRFRDSKEHPSAIQPGVPTRVHFSMNDVYHRFLKGHSVMVQVQENWFPLVDRNPNRFIDTYNAAPGDFQQATITVMHDGAHASSVTFGKLPLN